MKITFTAPVNTAKLALATFAVGVNGELVEVQTATVAEDRVIFLHLPEESLQPGDVVILHLDGLAFANGALFYGVVEPFVTE